MREGNPEEALRRLEEAGNGLSARQRFVSLLLRGETLGPAAFDAAAEMAAAHEIEPTGDIHASEAYQRPLARVLTVRVLERAAQRAAAASGGAT